MLIREFIDDFTVHLARLKDARPLRAILYRELECFHHRDFADLTALEVMKWHQGLSAKPYAANKALGVLKSVYERAREWGMYVGANPCLAARRFPKRSRCRYLSTADELSRLFASLDRESPMVRLFFRFLLCTAARRGEVVACLWEHLNLTAGTWYKPITKSGRSQQLPLPRALCDELSRLPKPWPWVFHTNRGKPWSVSKVETCWQIVRARAGLDDVTCHDLRRTAASLLARGGAPLHVISSVLNHRDYRTTQVYIRGVGEAPIVRASLEQLYNEMVKG